MFRIFRWTWQRISDWCTTLDVLEWIGWKTKLIAILVSVCTGIAIFLDQAPWYDIVGFSLAGALVVLGCVIAWQNRHDGSNESSHNPHKTVSIDLVPIREAAQKLYTEARACRSLWAKGAEEMSGSGISKGSPTDILDHMATLISEKKAIYGKKPPSQAWEQISRDTIRRLSFTESGTRLTDMFEDKSYFIDLSVKCADLDDLIAECHFQSRYGATSPIES
jgi:hypothetical protein